jgi:hypothetical protein
MEVLFTINIYHSDHNEGIKELEQVLERLKEWKHQDLYGFWRYEYSNMPSNPCENEQEGT